MRYFIGGLLTLVLSSAQAQTSTQEVLYFQDDVRYLYEVELLQRALLLTEQEYGPAEAKPLYHPTHLRGLFSLTRGKIHVAFLATSTQYETDYLPVRVPILQGMLGYRVLLTTPAKLAKINQLKQLKDLQTQAIAGFGLHWEGARVLRENHLLMLESSQYAQLFSNLASGKVDYIPRSLNEVFNEIDDQQRRGLQLSLSSKVAFFHPHIRYMFVARYNHKLAERLEKGLHKALEDGSFKAIFDKHFGHVKPYLEQHSHHVIQLENPTFPANLPEVQSSWWLPSTEANTVNYQSD